MPSPKRKYYRRSNERVELNLLDLCQGIIERYPEKYRDLTADKMRRIITRFFEYAFRYVSTGGRIRILRNCTLAAVIIELKKRDKNYENEEYRSRMHNRVFDIRFIGTFASHGKFYFDKKYLKYIEKLREHGRTDSYYDLIKN